ncbi:MAG: HD-GYP domain-containing protein [Acidiferrobacterales bacterium]
MKKRVDVGDLNFGMYIAELDRPWLETPFLFQGFELRTPDEMEQLKQHCQYVYIDTEQGPDLPKARGKSKLPARTRIVRAEEERLKREFKVLLESPDKKRGGRGGLPEPTRPRYQDQATLEEELEEAKDIESKAREVMANTIDDVRSGKPVDTAQAQKVVDDMIESVVRNPDALVGLTRIQYEGGFSSDQGVPVEEELGRAREIETRARTVIDGTLDKARKDQKIDADLAGRVVDEMMDSVNRNPDGLVVLSQFKDAGRYTALHSIRTCILALTFGRHLALSSEQLLILGLGSLLHDVGMIRLPEHILEKPVGLTQPEFALMKSHVRQGVDVLRNSKGFPPEAIQLVEQHHERHDGSGYPNKLTGDMIGMSGSIGAMVDVYDAITSQRIYRASISPEDALKRMYEWRHKDFQADLLEEFIKCMGIFPIGSLVELNTGGIGVVITINRTRRLKPKVALVLQANKEPYQKRLIADLAEHRDRMGRELRIRRVLPAGAYGINPMDHIAQL